MEWKALVVLGVILLSILPDIRWAGGRVPKRVVTVSAGPAQQRSERSKEERLAAPATVGDHDALILMVARKYEVPAGALYGIWKTESSGLGSGWGDGVGWLKADEIVQPDGRCVARYGKAWCDRQWRALVALCSQRRNGERICDPHDVRTSYAVATGPMQHLPIWIVKVQGGKAQWTERAVDHDRDGVVDPHDLDDAMAMTAKFLQSEFRKRGAWSAAINAYYGSQKEGYYEGASDKKGVAYYWKEWCATRGRCG